MYIYASDKTGVNELDGTQLDTLIIISISASRLHGICASSNVSFVIKQCTGASYEQAGAGEYMVLPLFHLVSPIARFYIGWVDRSIWVIVQLARECHVRVRDGSASFVTS